MDRLASKFLVGGERSMIDILERILSMPIIMRLACFVMLFSPIIAVMSILSGSVSQPNGPVYEYGAAKTLLELMLVAATALPAFVGGILMLIRRRSSIHLFAVGYLVVTVGSLFLSGIRESIEYMAPSVLGTLIIGGLVYTYLVSSSEVKDYFDMT